MNVKSYYNSILDKLISDYLYQNPRTLKAIKYALSHLSSSTKNVMDLGCGIGWTTFDFARHRSQTRFEGIDLSPKLIEKAKDLFSIENLDFQVSAFQDLLPKSGFYDAIILIDAFEHVALEDRKKLMDFCNASLSETGKIILTCPTRKHQEFLRQNFPDRLQPVDEIIEKADLEEFAHAVGGRLADYRKVTVWNSNDYFHALIDKNNQPLISKVDRYISERPRDKYKRVEKTGTEMKLSKLGYIFRMLKQSLKR